MTDQLDNSIPSSATSDLTDRFLLDEFLRSGVGPPERAEWAFRHLVECHSPMVLGVCRRQLGDSADAEDAAQAVFLVLWKKADSLHGAAMGGWLHRTALLVCRNAIRSRLLRRTHEERAAAMTSAGSTNENVDWSAVREVLDAELDRLPEKYRVPLILFHLEDRPLSQIAQQLAVSSATIGTWLRRARELLASRLKRRGITVGAVALATGLANVASAAPATPASVAATVTASSLYGSGHWAVAGGLSASTSTLAGACMKTGSLTLLKIAMACTVGGIAVGALVIGALFWRGAAAPVAPQPAPPAPVVEAAPPVTTSLSEVGEDSPVLVEEETDLQFGGITGQVVSTQPFPALEFVLDPNRRTNVPDESLLVDPQMGGIENVFVYLKLAPTPIHPQMQLGLSKRLVIDNVGAIPVPHTFFARVGQAVVFKNGSAVPINVHTNPTTNTGSHLMLKPMDRIGAVIHFGQPESFPFKIGDDFHPLSVSYGLVLNHPYAAITDAAGQFHISHLPVGTHSFRVWHERVGYIARDYPVTVTGGQIVTLPPLSVPAEKLLKR